MKMVVNLLLGNAMAAFAEGMALGEGLGISRKDVVRFIARHACGRAVSRIEAGENRERKLRSRISVALDAKGHASRDQ